MQKLVAIHAKNDSMSILRRAWMFPTVLEMLLTFQLSRAAYNCCPCCLCCEDVCSGTGRLIV